MKRLFRSPVRNLRSLMARLRGRPGQPATASRASQYLHKQSQDVERALDKPEVGDANYQAILTEIDRVYTRFVFRHPTTEEVKRHLGSFDLHLPTPRAKRRAVHARDIRQFLEIRPLAMETDLTNQCNLRCVFCYISQQRFSRMKRDDITVEHFKKTAEQLFPLCHTVNLARIAEPLLHPQFGELLGIANSYGVPKIGITTNALLFDERKIDEVMAGNLDHMVISIDSASKRTYERLRKKGNFDRLIANIRDINRAKRRHASVRPHLALSFIMMRSNIHELPALVRLAHDLEVCIVIANHLTPLAGLHNEDEVMSRDPDLCNRMMDEARALAEKYKIEIRMPQAFARPVPQGPLLQVGLSALATQNSVPVAGTNGPVDVGITNSGRRRENSFFGFPVQGNEHKSHCLFPWHFVIVTRYGDVLPCGGPWQASLGNIHQESFEDIWNNERYRALRAGHVTGNLAGVCQTCPATMMGNVQSEGAFHLARVA